MNKVILILCLVILSIFSFAQITTTQVAEKKEEISVKPYDGLKNFLGDDVYKYIGQDLYLKGKTKDLRKYGYSDFLLDYKKRPVERYKSNDGIHSEYEELVGKYFKVLDVHKHPKADESKYLYGKTYYLELEEKNSGEIIYFKYDSQYEIFFPFIVVLFFEKTKSNVVGEQFVFSNKLLKSKMNIETGDSISVNSAEIWTCIDLTIEEKDYNLALVFKNSLGEKIAIAYMYAIGKYSNGRSYTLVQSQAYHQKFGEKNWLIILDNNVVIGFTEEMVRLAWGEPKKINHASYGDQWIYENRYLYFENGKLKSFN